MAQIIIILDDEGTNLDEEHFSGLSEEDYIDIVTALEEFTVIDVRVMKDVLDDETRKGIEEVQRPLKVNIDGQGS